MKAIVYSTKVCPFCVQAKNLLKLKKIEYKEFIVVKDELIDGDVEKLKDGEILKSHLQNLIEKETGNRIETVPQIFIDDRYIGGFTDLVDNFNRKRDAYLERTLKHVTVNLQE
jgi:glutaredoxin